MDSIAAVPRDTKEVVVKTVSIYYVFYCKFKNLGCMELRQVKTRQDDFMDTDLNGQQEEREEEEQEKEKGKRGRVEEDKEDRHEQED